MNWQKLSSLKFYMTGVLFLLISAVNFAQENDFFTKQRISADFGSFRNRYLFPITNIKYTSPLIKRMNITFSGRLRSYGTLYFFTKTAYDFTPMAEYHFTQNNKSVYFTAGAGLDARIRLLKDERSTAESSAEPFLIIALHGNYNRLKFSAPCWTRFYTNGISLSVLPEIQYVFTEKISVFLRYELSYLKIYKNISHEWRQDSFIGTSVSF